MRYLVDGRRRPALARRVLSVPWRPAKARLAVGLLAALAVAASACTNAQPQASQGEHREHRPSPALAHPEVSGMRVISNRAVEPPVAAPDFDLVNFSGERVSLTDLRDRVVVFSFVYTNCSEACPILTGYYLMLQEQLSEPVDDGRLSLVFVTTDPDWDTPERLADYTRARGGKWLFLSGSLDALQPVWEGYGIYREARRGLEEVVVYHSYKTYLIDGSGMLRRQYTGVWQPEDVVPRIEELLEE